MSSTIDTSNLQSIRSALGMAALQKAMNRDVQTVAKIFEGMEESTAKMMELSVTPHKGANIDTTA